MSRMLLFFDTETTGLPRNWKAPVTDVDNWPRLVQIAWILFSEDGERINNQEYIIKPDNFTIPLEASKIHGITTEIAYRDGRDLLEVLSILNCEIQNSDILIAHNMSFDSKIIGSELVRNKLPTSLFSKELFCTMIASKNFCQIPGNYGYKWPKLSELYIKLFREDFEEAHNASADIEATAKSFWKLMDMNIIELPNSL